MSTSLSGALSDGIPMHTLRMSCVISAATSSDSPSRKVSRKGSSISKVTGAARWQRTILLPVTLARFRDMETKASPAVLQNWRFQQGLYRAYYDASLRSRLLDENGAVQKAYDILGRASEIGWAPEPLDISQRLSAAPANGLDPTILLDEAERVLSRVLFEPAGLALRTRVRELGEALFQSIRMQLAVDRYQGEAVNRAANLETLESPISDVSWLRAQLAGIRKLASANEQVAAIRQLLARKDPGPGGFYDEPGNPSNRPHVLLRAWIQGGSRVPRFCPDGLQLSRSPGQQRSYCLETLG